jgi:hypothetical protein
VAFTNILAFYVTELITAVTSFTIQAQKLKHSGKVVHNPKIEGSDPAVYTRREQMAEGERKWQKDYWNFKNFSFFSQIFHRLTLNNGTANIYMKQK